MMKPSSLLPVSNSTPWEKAMADSMAGGEIIVDSINAIRGTKIQSPPPSLLPFLIYEYGLGELTPFVPNLYDLIDQGIDWQRVRGTPMSVEIGLGWLGYTAEIEEMHTSTEFWNGFQLELDRVRDEFADLDRIDGIATLSVPVRSYFWRGFHGYDVRAMVWGMNSWGSSIWSEHSGVRTRLPDGPLWSFGRSYQFDGGITEEELVSIGAWVEPDWTNYDTTLGWGEFSWDSSEATWESGTNEAHAISMAELLYNRRCWVAFYDADDVVIGYRRARAFHNVVPVLDGPYSLEAGDFDVAPGRSTAFYIEAFTGFGNGNGKVAKSVAVVFDGAPVAPLKPGLLWLLPNQITGQSAPVLVRDVDIAMGESIREQVKFLVRLDGAYEPPAALTDLESETDGFVIDFKDNSYAEKL